MKKIKWMGIVLLTMALGCTTSKITTSWKAKDAIPRSYHKIMVLGLIREADRSIQQHMEDHFVGDLKDLGYNAVSSLQEYGPKAFDKMNEKAALSKLKNSGIDAVITIVLLDKQKERDYIPARTSNPPSGYGYGYDRFWDYRTARYNHIYEPGYYVTNTKYFWESNLYDIGTQKLVYSVQTQSFDSANAESTAHQYGLMIVKNMVKQDVLMKTNDAGH